MKTFEQYINYTVEDWLEDADFIQWVKSPQNHTISSFDLILEHNGEAAERLLEAKVIVQSVCSSSAELSDMERARIWHNIIQRTEHSHARPRKIFVKLAAAASIVLLLVAGSVFFLIQRGTSLQRFAQVLSVDSIRDIQFVMPNEKSVTLENLSEVKMVDDGKIEIRLPKGDRIVIQTEQKAGAVCQLVVPGGKRAGVVLSDGTHISVHPGSKVVFPVQLGRKQREVYLEGEAFLNVAKNPNSPFAVQTRRMEVNVLGTSFNVMAYPKQSVQSVVLVTGHVKVKSEDGTERRIEPNQHYFFDTKTKAEVVETVNTDDYTSWKDGILNFNSQPLSQILNQLSRYYNVSFAYNASISKIKLSGKLDLNNTMEAALKVLTTVAPIEIKSRENEYVINVKQ